MARVTDLRLIVLLMFNAFEEVIKAIAAWRLSCSLDELPKTLTNNSSLLFDVVMAEKSAKKFRDKARKLSELRNEVAHGFHKRGYKSKLSEFVNDITGKPCSSSAADRQREFIRAVNLLALDIGVHVNEIPERGEFPVPMLGVELGDITS